MPLCCASTITLAIKPRFCHPVLHKSHNTGVFTECFKPGNSYLQPVELLWQSGVDSSRAHCCINEAICRTRSCTQQDSVTENWERKPSNQSYRSESWHYFVTVPGRWKVGVSLCLSCTPRFTLLLLIYNLLYEYAFTFQEVYTDFQEALYICWLIV